MLGQSFTRYFLGLLFLAGCAAQTGNVQEFSAQEGMHLVSDIRLVDENGQAKLFVDTSSDIKYNVFKLTDPNRIMVDLIDAQVSPEMAKQIEGSGAIQSVQVQSIDDALSSLVRLEVRLSADANYLAGMESTGLAVRIMPVNGAWVSDADITDEAAENFEMDDFFSDDWESLSEVEIPAAPMGSELPTPSELAEAPAATPDLPELPEIEDSFEATESPELLDAPGFEVAEQLPLLPLPMPIPVPMESRSSESETSPAPAPMPLEEPMDFSEIPMIEDESATPVEETRVLVEPEDEAELPPSILTQDIPTNVFTAGTSLLSGMGDRVYTGTRVSLEFQDAEIQDVIRLIAEVSKLNVIIGDNVSGRLTLKLVDVPWDQALDIILTSRGLDKVQHGNILRVAPIEALKKERETALANDQAAKQLEPLRLKLFNINYAASAEMAGRIQNLVSERGKVDVDPRTNTLIVEDIGENLSRIENLIKVLDTQTPQVRIESRIVQASDTFARSVGIQWGPTLRLDEGNNNQTSWQFPRRIGIGAPVGDPGAGFRAPTPGDLGAFAVDALPGAEETGGALGFRLGSVSDVFNLDLQLRYAETEQIARIVSRPSITVLDNRTARIIQGSRIPFLSAGSEGSNVAFQDAGIEVSVTPQITNDGSIILQVSTRSNEPGGAGVGGNQIINIREAETELLVKSGRTAVLGGVFKTSDTFGRGGVPGLMRLPILGWLFKGESNTVNREETLIFITPTILSDGREAVVSPGSEQRP
jgi:type IV pilus secretin PilQ/predicted competence protein